MTEKIKRVSPSPPGARAMPVRSITCSDETWARAAEAAGALGYCGRSELLRALVDMLAHALVVNDRGVPVSFGISVHVAGDATGEE